MDYYPPSHQKTLILTVKDLLHSLYGLLLHVGEDVRVGVEGYGDGRVPEHLLNDLRMNSIFTGAPSSPSQPSYSRRITGTRRSKPRLEAGRR